MEKARTHVTSAVSALHAVIRPETSPVAARGLVAGSRRGLTPTGGGSQRTWKAVYIRPAGVTDSKKSCSESLA